MTWREFAQQEPALAALGRERLNCHGLAVIGTLRKNGWPRISPVEPLFINEQLYLGMMWGYQKHWTYLETPGAPFTTQFQTGTGQMVSSNSMVEPLTSTTRVNGNHTLKPCLKRSVSGLETRNSTALQSIYGMPQRVRWSVKNSSTRFGPLNDLCQMTP